jgi:hypothetical protein
MATGRETSAGGGVFAAADVRGGGDMEWSSLIGIHPGDPLVSGGGGTMPGFDPDYGGHRIVTLPSGQSGAAGTGGLTATPDNESRHAVAMIDDWRDLFNFSGSPMPWMLLIALGILFFAHASIKARAGAFGRQATASAALG